MCVARPLNGLEQLAILVGILMAAQLLWRFVEKPFRAGSGLANATAMTAIGVGCLAVLALGLLLRADRASLWRLSEPARRSVGELRTAAKVQAALPPGCQLAWRRAGWRQGLPLVAAAERRLRFGHLG